MPDNSFQYVKSYLECLQGYLIFFFISIKLSDNKQASKKKSQKKRKHFNDHSANEISYRSDDRQCVYASD